MHSVASSRPMFDVAAVRAEFPILSRTVHGSMPLVYLDNAATTQKPNVVIDAVTSFYRQHNANAHRAGHVLGMEVTAMYEQARHLVADLIGATSDEIIFTRGTTESLNLLATVLGQYLSSQLPGSNIVITEMEHHANIVPWQMLRDRTGVELRVIPVLADGSLDLESAATLIDESTAIVSCVHVSNTLGTTNDVTLLCRLAREANALSIVDAAQSISSVKIDVKALGCDALVFSGHKLHAPMGIGVAYIRHDLLEMLPPYQGGGSMITNVTFESTTYAHGPLRFEAGTPNIEGAVGLGRAIEWFTSYDLRAVQIHKQELTHALVNGLRSRDGITVHGRHQEHSGIVSFTVDGVHPHDVGILLDEQGIAVRIGHHCTMPLSQKLCTNGTVRVSAAIYTTNHEIEAFFVALDRSLRMLR